MLQGIRNRAFNRYAKQFGKQDLLDRLRENFEKGISYHKPNGLKGDYDLLTTEDEIMQLIQYGKNNPYIECPIFESGHFALRLVTEDDSLDLLMCYSDPEARKIFNSDTCTSDCCYNTIEEMHDCIKGWVNAYVQKEFVRFAIIDKSINRAVGTIEMFGMVGKYKTPRGILRLDIASMYEAEGYLYELFSLCIKEFLALFAVNQVVTKAIPEAANRIVTLGALGFEAYDFPGREHYWIYDLSKA